MSYERQEIEIGEGRTLYVYTFDEDSELPAPQVISPGESEQHK